MRIHDDNSFEFDDTDIDVCVRCGRYYGWTKKLTETWVKLWKPLEGERMPQLCTNCMEGGR